ncbi:ribosome maturation factor RimM [Burkholderia sp. WAC0059]|uniref:ribosome maturation factor RimM n=1 Tax=Burkholderia sp. WAC0059 TaxID=2066022 RepID=UPI000C7F2CC9|nr:ribosome maturation factor RimM [Burkholderia sp. WAC0059]PLZ01826.1 ribosome maturation factor RimM [Burkholderia sp. WAC0059]
MSAHDEKPEHDESIVRSGRRVQPSFGAFVPKPGRSSAARSVAADAAETSGQAESAQSLQSARWPDDAIEVGAIVDAYGLKGWVKVAAHAGIGRGGNALVSAKRWWLVKGRERKPFACLAARIHGDSVVAQLAGVADRDAALLMRGYRVHVGRDEFPALEADEFYWVDLIGLEVVNEAGVALGKVADLIDNGAHSVLRIDYPSTDRDGKPATGERLIPFVGVYVKTVDQAAKRIVVDWEADY